MNKFRLGRLVPAAWALALLALAGCDAAEQSAQKLADEAKKEAQALLNDSIGEVVDEVNRQVDTLQESTNRALGKPQQDEGDEAPEKEEAAQPSEQGVET